MLKNYFVKPIRKRFIDAFPKFKADGADDTGNYFWETWLTSPFYDSSLTEQDLSDIYNHLMAEFYNWHFIYPDDMGIAYNVMHIIEDYFPNVKERLSLLNQLRGMTLDNFKKSGIQISSTGSNPKVETDMDELIDLVDSQNANFQLKSDEQAIRAKFFSLYDGVMQEFIDRFKPLFVKLYNGVADYVYINPIEENEGE